MSFIANLLKTCGGALKLKDINDKFTYSTAGFLLNRDEIANPCGLIAKSFFNG